MLFRCLFCVLTIVSCSRITLANTYYSVTSASPHLIASWNTLRDGTGTTPANFTTSGDVFVIQGIGGLLGAPHTMTTSSTWTIGVGVTVKVETNAVLQGNSTITFNASANFVLDSAATYNHNNTGNYASTILQGIEDFHKQSNFIILNSTGTGPGTPANGGYGNLIINSNGSSQVNCNGVLTAIKNNFIIQKTGNSSTIEFRLTGSTNFTLDVGGNLEIQNGIINFSNNTGIGTINVNKDLIMTGGELKNTGTTNPNTQVINFSGSRFHQFVKTGGVLTSLTANGRIIHFVVLSGDTLNMANNIMDNGATSTANFTLANGGTLQLGDVNGIATTGALGNIQVSGTRIFNKGANYVYNGTASQITGNAIPDTVRSLAINNANGLTLSNPSLTDTAFLFLTSGLINTDATHVLVLANTANVISAINAYGNINEGNQNSFVNGPLQIESKTTTLKTFPIGVKDASVNYFAPVRVTPNNSVSKKYTATYYHTNFSDLTTDVTIHHVSTIEYWDVSCDNVFSGTAILGLSWRPSSNLCVSGCTVADSTAAWDDLLVGHYFFDGLSTKWRTDGGATLFNMQSGSSLNYGYVSTTVYVNPASPFTLGSKSNFNILPLQLVDFFGRVRDNSIDINWETSDEKNIGQYELQKSTDGINFNTIQIFTAKNSSANNSYFATDIDAIHGINYYRLKIREQNQRTSYSRIIKVNFQRSPTWTIYPNPVKDVLQIRYGNDKLSAIKIKNVLGQDIPVKYRSIGPSGVEVNLSHLQRGWYILNGISNGEVLTKTFFKN